MAGAVLMADIGGAVLPPEQVIRIQEQHHLFREDIELSVRKGTIAGPPQSIYLRLWVLKEAGASQAIRHMEPEVIGDQVSMTANQGKLNVPEVVDSR